MVKTIEEKKEYNRIKMAERRKLNPIENSFISINSQNKKKNKPKINKKDFSDYLNFLLKHKFIKSLHVRRKGRQSITFEAFKLLKRKGVLIP